MSENLMTETTLPDLASRYSIPYQTLVTAARAGRLQARKAGPRAWLTTPLELVAAAIRGALEARALPGVRVYETCHGGYAVADRDEDGPCRIAWIDEKGRADIDDGIDGYIVGEHLFWPGDAYSDPGAYITDDGQPDPAAPWADIETGQSALIGIPGAPLAVL